MNTIPVPRETLEQALAAWDRGAAAMLKIEMERLRAALEQPASEPVAVPQGWKFVCHPITEEMHVAACKVLNRAQGLDGLPQRMLDAMLSASPKPERPASEPKTAVDRIAELDASIDKAIAEYMTVPQVDEAMLHTWLELGAPESFKNVTARDMLIALQYFQGMLIASPKPAAGQLQAWGDPKTQAIYEILCSEDQPPEGEHWEGFTARRIAALLTADTKPDDLPTIAYMAGHAEGKKAAGAKGGEAVAWLHPKRVCATTDPWYGTHECVPNWIPLYTHPAPAAQPLTAQEIKTLCAENGWDDSWQSIRFARTVIAEFCRVNGITNKENGS